MLDKYIFISHSSKDSGKVNEIVSFLESSGVKCWISTRDITPGSDWAETIYDAISNSSGMLLIYSSNVNRSGQIRNELDIATNLEIPIIPLKMEDVEFSKGVKYFTNSHQWLDASGGWKHVSDLLLSSINKTLSNVDYEAPEIKVDKPGRKCPWRTPALIVLSILVLIPLLIHFLSDKPLINNPDNLINMIAGGTDSWDYATDILASSDGGFTATGTWDWGFWSEWWIVHIDSTGRIEWSWSDSLAGEDKPLMLSASNGDIICASGEYADFDHTGFPVRALRIDSLGQVLWNNEWWITWPGAVQPELVSFDMNSDSTLILSFTLRQLSIGSNFVTHQIFLNTSGELMHRDTLSGSDTSRELVVLENNSYLHIYKDSSTRANGIELISTDGNLLDRIIIGDTRSSVTCGLALPDGDIILLMTKDSYGAGNGDLSVNRFTSELELKWEKVFGGDLSDAASDVTLLADGDILIAGSTRSWGNGSSDGWLLKLNQDGEELWQAVIDMGGDDYLYSISANDQDLIFASGATTLFGQPDAWILQVSPEGTWNNRAVTGIDLFNEDWEKGFIDQTIWKMGQNRNYTPVLHENSLTGNYTCDVNHVPLVTLSEFHLKPGLSLSADILIPDMPDARGCNWLAIGMTRSTADEFHLDPGSVSDKELRWSYTDGIGDQNREIAAICRYDGAVSITTEPESLWLQRGIPQTFEIEICSETVRFRLNDSLFCEDSMNVTSEQDSVRIYLWGSSGSLPHHFDNIRLFSRRW